MYGSISLPVSRHHLADTAHPTAGQHYGLTLNDTPFVDERVIEHILRQAFHCVMQLIFSWKNTPGAYRPAGIQHLSPLSVNKQIDILRARRATGLMTRDNYRT